MFPHRQVVQALLWASDGLANEEIARRSRVDSDAVRRCRKRFTDKGLDGVGGIAKGPRAEVLAAAGHGGAGVGVDADR